jgi:hypothetical protein
LATTSLYTSSLPSNTLALVHPYYGGAGGSVSTLHSSQFDEDAGEESDQVVVTHDHFSSSPGARSFSDIDIDNDDAPVNHPSNRDRGTTSIFSVSGSAMPSAQLFQCSREEHIVYTGHNEGCHRIKSRDQCLETAIRYYGNDLKCEWDSGVCHPGCGCGWGKTSVGSGTITREHGKFVCNESDRKLRPGMVCSQIKYRDACLDSKVDLGGHQVLCEWDSGVCHNGCGCGY